MSNMFADKIAKLVRKTKEVVTDIRIDKLSKLSNKAIAGVGIAALATIAICGAFAFSGPEQPESTILSEAPKAEVQAENPTTYYAIEVDELVIAGLATEQEAQAVLDSVVDHYSTEESELINLAYKEKVEIVEMEAVDPELMSVTDACNMIITGTKEPKLYTVAEGDCLWDIAVKNNMSVEELVASNPDADVDRLKIGMTLNLYELKPFVHVSLTERVTSTENIDYAITYEETSTLYKGEIKVKTAGVYGQREVTKELVKENGKLVSTSEVASAVKKEPSPQVNLKGTKSLATLVGTGAFIGPMGSLEISSPYGSRGGGRHTGVDFRNPKGTPIYAVDDGVVTYTGYRGTYGNIVKLSHGNGIETWYAHCDTMIVSTGDVVNKGQQIATVGITGRATGYHLHFEVRKNGVPQNPMNYL